MYADFCGELTVSELTIKTGSVNADAFDKDIHALNMWEEIDLHVYFFILFFFAMIDIHKEIQRSTFALFTKEGSNSCNKIYFFM